MRRTLTSALVYFLLIAVPQSYGQMMDDMEKHMKDMMGGTGSTMEDKEARKELTREAQAAGVTVKATYKNPGENKPPVFEVALDTHSVDLDRYGFDEVVVLRDDLGKEYRPGVVSSSGSGHHREAALEFRDADLASARYFELVIRGVAGVEERVFRFDLYR